MSGRGPAILLLLASLASAGCVNLSPAGPSPVVPRPCPSPSKASLVTWVNPQVIEARELCGVPVSGGH